MMEAERLKQLVQKYNRAIPRYTSYPTAPQWGDMSGEDWLASVSASAGEKVSLYFHVPFCRSACYYCACNIIVSPKRQLVNPYLEALFREIDFYSQGIVSGCVISQLHFGGGTPTYLSVEELEILLSYISNSFSLDWSPEREFSIEIDPRVTTRDHLKLLRDWGFNRLSLGVQDFDEKVQSAINRIQSYDSVREIVEYARDIGFESINFDLIYGLPYQTQESFSRTMSQVDQLAPNRIALFNYAHLPSLIPHQKAYIKEDTLPSSEEKISIFIEAMEFFQESGYRYIGLDHFTRVEDPLYQAYVEGTLNRNFQGYSIKKELDMYALGVTSISSVGPMYYQNVKKINTYMSHWMENPSVPLIEKGLILSDEDIIRRDIVRSILCNGQIDLQKYQFLLQDDLSYEKDQLQALKEDGLLCLEQDQLTVSELGRLFLRNIASVFDTYLRRDQRTLYSQSV